jgi:O-methyltransferase
LERLPSRRELRDLGAYRRRARLYRVLLDGGWTMLSPRSGRKLSTLASAVERAGVPGALVDCGAWNGGSTVLLASGAPTREAWAFDSFSGLPEPDERDQRTDLGGELVASEAKLREGFERFAPGSRLHVCPGWFEDTLPDRVDAIGAVAILHCDGDWYESVRLALEVLYPSVSAGGFVVVDDYGTFPGARRATDEFRARVGVTAPLRRVGGTARYWQK